MNQRTEDCSKEIHTLTDFQATLEQDCSAYLDDLSQNKPIVQVGNITMSDVELDIKKELLTKLRTLRRKVLSQQKDIEDSLQGLEARATQCKKAMECEIVEDIASIHSFFVAPVEDADVKLEAEKKKLEEHIRALMLCSDCSADLKDKAISTVALLSKITKQEQLDTFYAVSIQPLQREFEGARIQVQERKEGFRDLQVRYATLCSISGIQPETFTLECNGLEAIKKDVAALEKQVVMQAEQEYISDCVNEVISEMGYDIIGNRSVTKRSGKQFRNELFSYGDGTAINVTYDTDGQIAMELGGIDRIDRIPTSYEADALYEDMESFCLNFKDFEERLETKGVMIKSRVSMAPPSTEYATIINVADYNITTTKPARDIAVKEKRSKNSAKQMLRKENN
ncbi:hypothetical protein [Paenibacillus sp. FSL R10-2734]|uniref:hypothetical protein n=1 Tax=Paenibacillus sp. FSL R10-2734 TaxID=2954691 RepID=UPI0030D9D98B